MGSKLSIFKKPLNETEHKQSSTDNNKEESTQPSSELKDQSNKPLEPAVNGIVESVAEELSKIELKEQSETVNNDRDITQDSKQETEEPSKCVCNPCECNPCNCDRKEVDKIESQVNQSDDKAIVEDSKQELVPSNDNEEPKEPAKCLCNPCECNPCNCVAHDHKEDNSESVVIENNDKVTEEEPKHETVEQSESMPSENDSTPQEPNQELANPSDVS
jgi:hypothetical protein